MAPPRALSFYDSAMANGGMTRVSGTPAIIEGGVYFEELPTSDAIDKLVVEVMKFDSLAGRPEGGRWQPVANFDISKHVIRHDCADEAAILAFVQDIMGKPLLNAAAGPLWEVHLLSSASGRSLMLFRVEHACADGMAILQVLSSIATTTSGEPLPPATFSRPPRAKQSWWKVLCSSVCSAIKYAGLPTGPFDSSVPFRPSPPGELLKYGERKLVTLPPHSLNVIKRTKNAIGRGVTVNDVCYAAFAGAVRRYCDELYGGGGWRSKKTLMRALVPVALPRKATTPLTNDWTFVSTELPISEPTAATRVQATHSIFSRLKNSVEVVVARLLVTLNSMLPWFIFGFMGQALMSRHSVIFSNVPGPSMPIAIGGREVVGLLPVFPNLIPQVLCVSYKSTMWMTMTVDPSAVTKPEMLCELYLEELKSLALTYGVDINDTTEPKTEYEPPRVAPPAPAAAAAPSSRSGGSLAEMV